MLFLFWLAVIQFDVLAEENIKYVPLKVTRNKTVGNVTTSIDENRNVFDVVNSNDYNFILQSINLKAVNLKIPNGDTILHHAVYKGSTESLIALLGKGVEVDLKDGKGRTAMWVAASKGNVASLKVLYEFGADINETREGCVGRKRTLLHEAAITGNDEAVSWLAEMKVDLEARECDGWTPLHWAAFYGNTKTLEILLRNGANANVRSDFFSRPLHWAAEKSHLGSVFLLLQMGASLDAQDKDGWTPLHRAAQYGRLETVRLLVSNGAKLDSKTTDHMTPVMIAQYWGYSQVEDFLMRAVEIDEPPKKKLILKNEALKLRNCFCLPIFIAFIYIINTSNP